jgi:hypothetical protein
MPFLPSAHAASLLRRDDAGRTIFLPDGDDDGYVVPDAATGHHILRQLRRIRLAQLAAWLVVLAAFFGLLVATDAAGLKIAGWLFALVCLAAVAPIQLLANRARGRLARDLVPVPKDATEPSSAEMLRVVVVILLIVAAVGIALYLGRATPLHALWHVDEIAHLLVGSKMVVKVALLAGGAAAVLWAGIRAVRKRVRPSG